MSSHQLALGRVCFERIWVRCEEALMESIESPFREVKALMESRVGVMQS